MKPNVAYLCFFMKNKFHIIKTFYILGSLTTEFLLFANIDKVVPKTFIKKRNNKK